MEKEMTKLENLTEKQMQVLTFLKEYQKENGCPPSLREIARHIGVTKHSAEERLRYLEYKGFIARIFNRPRGIKVLEAG